MKPAIQAQTVEEYAKKLMEEYQCVGQVALFGSRVKGTNLPNSDYDIFTCASSSSDDDWLLADMAAKHRGDTIDGTFVDLFTFSLSDMLSIHGGTLSFDVIKHWKEGVDFITIQEKPE